MKKLLVGVGLMISSYASAVEVETVNDDCIFFDNWFGTGEVLRGKWNATFKSNGDMVWHCRGSIPSSSAPDQIIKDSFFECDVHGSFVGRTLQSQIQMTPSGKWKLQCIVKGD